MTEVLWYYDEGGKPAGPISQAAVLEALQAGRLAAGTRVWRAGLAGWQAWETVPELAAARPAPPPAPVVPATPPSSWSAGAPAPSSGAAAPAPSGWRAAEGALEPVGPGLTVALGVVTFGIYPLVKFYQCGKAYERLTPARPSRFDQLFWTWLGLNLVATVFAFTFRPLGVLVQIGAIVAGVYLLGEVLAARTALVARSGARVELTPPETHRLYWILGEVLTFFLVGLVLLVIQAVKFFADHDRLAEALGPVAPARPAPAGWGPAPGQGSPSAGGRFCTRCGAPLAPEVRFCTACGAGPG